MSHENEINEARALCFDVHTDCLWVVSLIETKMNKSTVITICFILLLNVLIPNIQGRTGPMEYCSIGQ